MEEMSLTDNPAAPRRQQPRVRFIGLNRHTRSREEGEDDETHSRRTSCCSPPCALVIAQTKNMFSGVFKSFGKVARARLLIQSQPNVFALGPMSPSMKILNSVRGCASKPNGIEEKRVKELLNGILAELDRKVVNKSMEETYRFFDCGCNVTRMLVSLDSRIHDNNRVVFANDKGGIPPTAVLLSEVFAVLNWIRQGKIAVVLCGNLKHQFALLSLVDMYRNDTTLTSRRWADIVHLNRRLLRVKQDEDLSELSSTSKKEIWFVADERKMELVTRAFPSVVKKIPSLVSTSDKEINDDLFFEGLVLKRVLVWNASTSPPKDVGASVAARSSSNDAAAKQQKSSMQQSRRSAEEESLLQRTNLLRRALSRSSSNLREVASDHSSPLSSYKLNPYLMITNDSDSVLFAGRPVLLSSPSRAFTRETKVADAFGTRVPVTFTKESAANTENETSDGDRVFEFSLPIERTCAGDLRIKVYCQNQTGTTKQELLNVFTNTLAVETTVAGIVRSKAPSSLRRQRVLMVCDSEEMEFNRAAMESLLFSSVAEDMGSFKVGLEFGFSNEFVRSLSSSSGRDGDDVASTETRFALPVSSLSSSSTKEAKSEGSDYFVVCPSCWEGIELQKDPNDLHQPTLAVSCSSCNPPKKSGGGSSSSPLVLKASHPQVLQSVIAKGIEQARAEAARQQQLESDESDDEDEQDQEEEKRDVPDGASSSSPSSSSSSAQSDPPRHPMLSSLLEMFPDLLPDKLREINSLLWTKANATAAADEQVFNDMVSMLIAEAAPHSMPTTTGLFQQGEFVQTELFGLGSFQGESRCEFEDASVVNSLIVRFPFGVGFFRREDVHPLTFEQNLQSSASSATSTAATERAANSLTHSPASVTRRKQYCDGATQDEDDSHQRYRRQGARFSPSILDIARSQQQEERQRLLEQQQQQVSGSPSTSSEQDLLLSLDELLARSLQEQEFLGGGGSGHATSRGGRGGSGRASALLFSRGFDHVPISSSTARVLSLPTSTFSSVNNNKTPTNSSLTQKSKRKQRDLDGGDNDEMKCLICQCGFVDGDSLRTLPCFHRFHLECVDPWLVQKPKCPLCKTEITAATEE